jgi:opacity protein-like surface antigen
MFGLKLKQKCVAVMLLAGLMASGAGIMQAQSTRRTRRESNANRQARIARIVKDTYSHKWEVGGGGGYLRYRSGEGLQRNNEVSFWLSGTRYFNPKFGLETDIRGAFGNAKISPYNAYLKFNPQISEYAFMAGPTYRFYAKEKTAVSVFALGGAGVGKFDGGSEGIPSSLLGTWPSETRAAFSVGLNLDYNFYPNLALRITPTYLGTTFGGTIQNNAGFNIGLVYRFGRNK